MKLARFRVNDWESYGLVEREQVRDIHGSIFGEHTVSQAAYPLSPVQLLPPTRPTSFWAVGLNYTAHVAHQEIGSPSPTETPAVTVAIPRAPGSVTTVALTPG